MEQRQAWVDENLSLISAVTTDPLGHISEWEGCEEPFLFLAAAEEYHALVVAKTRTHSHIPCAIDATCSGLQVLAGCSFDGSTAALVNVLPGSKPSDAYQAVADKVNTEIPDEWGFKLCRSDVKRAVLVIPYNGTVKSTRDYLREALKKREVDFESEQLNTIVRLTRAAMETVVPGPMRVMTWLNQQISEAIRGGAEHIQWTTPTGFVVKQDLRKVNTERVVCHLLGKIDLQIGT